MSPYLSSRTKKIPSHSIDFSTFPLVLLLIQRDERDEMQAHPPSSDYTALCPHSSSLEIKNMLFLSEPTLGWLLTVFSRGLSGKPPGLTHACKQQSKFYRLRKQRVKDNKRTRTFRAGSPELQSVTGFSPPFPPTGR
ncbi:hypothetical protein GN956_G6429 [Arapaima gigas]